MKIDVYSNEDTAEWDVSGLMKAQTLQLWVKAEWMAPPLLMISQSQAMQNVLRPLDIWRQMRDGRIGH